MRLNIMRGLNTIIERYEKLELKESLNRSYLYPIACKELAFILRNAYQKTPKSLQALIFQDILTAFSLLPQIQTQSGVSAANMLLQSAEASLPKQKRVLAVTEFKHAMVAHKRRSKAQQDEQGALQLPQDVLVHTFSFLDLHSLLSAAAVNRSWNAAASDNHLWESLYADFFSDFSILLKVNRLQIGGVAENKDNTNSKENLATGLRTDWRYAFQRAYKGSAKKFKSYRGYCRHCSSIVWLNHAKCSFTSSGDNCHTHHIKTLSSQQIVDYLLNDSLSSYSSSDSDSDTDTDDGSVLKLWAYPPLHFLG